MNIYCKGGYMSNFLHLEGEYLQIKGAVKIVSSTQNQAIIEMTDTGIVITGNDLEVKKLNLDEQEVILSGKFLNFKFGMINAKKIPLYKRIFK